MTKVEVNTPTDHHLALVQKDGSAIIRHKRLHATKGWRDERVCRADKFKRDSDGHVTKYRKVGP